MEVRRGKSSNETSILQTIQNSLESQDLGYFFQLNLPSIVYVIEFTVCNSCKVAG
jgi:hypothetical protein